MRYLITTNECYEPFLTDWFDESNFNLMANMIVYDLKNCKYTDDGVTWFNIEIDHL